MNANIGDRYACSDCGCEIEIKSAPENSQAASVGDTDSESNSVSSLRRSEAESISTPGDYGSQGAGGEGMFGTSGSGSSGTMQGRYGSTTSRRPTDSSASSPSVVSQSGTMTCFCGSDMRPSSRGQSRAAGTF